MPKTHTNVIMPKDRFFLMGFGLFFLGVIGTFIGLYQSQQKQIPNLLSEQTLALVQLKLTPTNLEFIQEHLNLTPNTPLLLPGVKTDDLTWQNLSPWLGRQVAFSWHSEQRFLHAFSYRRKGDAQAFISRFALPDETLTTTETEFGTIYSPAYSSHQAFLLTRGWLLWADSPETLIQQLGSEQKLNTYKPFLKLQRDLPALKLASLYLNLEGDTSDWTQGSQNQAYAPMLRGLGSSTPQWGVSIAIDDNTLKGDAKIITHQAVYDKAHPVAKANNQTIPNLAYFSPKNALFFQNGHNLYAKYQHTKNYLAELDPQLSLVFEGLIRAQAENWFGPNFDFETDFLELIQGQYAFVLDFHQGLEIGFISTLGPDQDPESINELIQKAQARFTPVLETVELPDGTIREELVAADPQSVPIIKNEQDGVSYYTAQKDDGTINFSYAQFDGFLIMANRVNLIEKIITAKTDQSKSLAANQDFRESVMFDFSPAEVYGFINAPKLQQLNYYWQQTQTAGLPLNLDQYSSLRNMVFSKQVFPEAIFLKLRLFFN